MPAAARAATTAATAEGTVGRIHLTRREGLTALALLAPAGLLAACSSGSVGPTPASATATTPPEDVASRVAVEESVLIATYDSVLAATPALGEEAAALLTLIRDQHVQHLAALERPDTPSPSSSPPPVDGTTAVARLIAVEREAARSRVRACVETDDAELARLLVFIGASEASHVPALRDLGPVGT